MDRRNFSPPGSSQSKILAMYLPSSRRRFLRNFTLGAAGLWVPGAFAEALTLTPKQTEGPFYPINLPLDTDNDLIRLNDSLTPALGEVTHLSGKVTDVQGNPIRNALVEIWQVDHNGVYLHKDSGNAEKRDSNFQGFGRFMMTERETRQSADSFNAMPANLPSSADCASSCCTFNG